MRLGEEKRSLGQLKTVNLGEKTCIQMKKVCTRVKKACTWADISKTFFENLHLEMTFI